MLSIIEISYSSVEKIKKMNKEDYEKLRSEVPYLELPVDQLDIKSYSLHNIAIDVEEMEILSRHGVVFEVKKMRSSEVFKDRIVNNYAIEIPNVGLLAVDEVTLMEDCCTDRLQEKLNEGWRILAICPTTTRRPDYILGRTQK